MSLLHALHAQTVTYLRCCRECITTSRTELSGIRICCLYYKADLHLVSHYELCSPSILVLCQDMHCQGSNIANVEQNCVSLSLQMS